MADLPDLYPLTFEPVFKPRVWGGRMLEALYAKRLPPSDPIGESWEIADRPGDESVIVNGPYAKRSLRWLMEQHGGAITGSGAATGGRFPLLCKILDAREKLSLQVHPPSSVLGEPKTEMWYIAHADPGAELYVGLKRGVTRDRFERALHAGTVADCFHRIAVRAGDTMFLPSGRVHAIGSGLVIFEIQQNSDTTFRVFDWNRVGLDGRPRDLHVAESLQSIDFADVEPALVDAAPSTHGHFGVRALVRHRLFDADLYHAEIQDVLTFSDDALRVVAVVNGRVRASGGGVSQDLGPGEFCVLPALLARPMLDAGHGATFLVVKAGPA
jgi:mannose-6-phosphate isomerase